MLHEIANKLYLVFDSLTRPFALHNSTLELDRNSRSPLESLSDTRGWTGANYAVQIFARVSDPYIFQPSFQGRTTFHNVFLFLKIRLYTQISVGDRIIQDWFFKDKLWVLAKIFRANLLVTNNTYKTISSILTLKVKRDSLTVYHQIWQPFVNFVFSDRWSYSFLSFVCKSHRVFDAMNPWRHILTKSSELYHISGVKTSVMAEIEGAIRRQS